MCSSLNLLSSLFIFLFFLAITQIHTVCLKSGTWTGFIEGKPIWDSYLIFYQNDPTAFSIMPASSGTSWGSGEGLCDGDNFVFMSLDASQTFTGIVNSNGTEVIWDNQSSWKLQQVSTVHVVWMNHLDVGYNGIPNTGFINNVLNTYFHTHFPRALRLQAALKEGGFSEKFIYTTHPWLVSLYLDCPAITLAGVTLECPGDDEKQAFIDAIMRGDINWHAGPFNLQIENMDSSLFEYGLTIAQDLDAMFNITRKFGVLSQRDVPGTTRSAIPYLVKNNVIAITIGQNGATPPVGVPKLYRWRDTTTNTEIIGINHAKGYGWIDRVDDPIAPNGVALAYAFRTDNSGPPTSLSEVLTIYGSLRGQYPGANVFASTYDAFVNDILPVVNSLPVVTNEVGDIWIQGISSDPLKEIQFREISRARTTCINSGRCDISDPRIKAMSRFLIKIPEHTWGLPGVYDSENWSNKLFNQARNGPNYQNCARAWLEQRMFNQLAISALEDHPLATELKARLAAIVPVIPSTQGMQSLDNLQSYLFCGSATLQFDGTTGAIVNFFDGTTKWADITAPIAKLMYTSFNESDFNYMEVYYGGNAGYDKYNSTCSQPGCANPVDAMWPSTMTALYWSQSTCSGVVVLQSQTIANSYYGAPQNSYVAFKIVPTSNGATLLFNVTLWNKTPTRLPEQMMLEFRPPVSLVLDWQMDKLGGLVSPLDVLLNGSQYQHAVWSGIQATNEQQGIKITVLSLDAPLTAPITTQPRFPGWMGTPTAMPVPTAPLKDSTTIAGMAFNLFNNVWDTNYIFWYPYLQGVGDENILFRFVITTQNDSSGDIDDNE